MKRKAVFTRADLVVAVLCIGFLLANIAAVGPGGQRHAKEMLCISKLHKWGEFSRSYLNDNGGYFHRGWLPPELVENVEDWAKVLRPYYKNDDMRLCPEATVPGSEIGVGPYGGVGTFVGWGVFGSAWLPPNVLYDGYGSYGMNAFLCNPPAEILTVEGHPTEYNWRTGNVSGAGNIPLFTDSQWRVQLPHHSDYPPDYDGYPWGIDHYNSMLRICMNRHRGYVGSGFLDGSARKVGLKELWTLKWHREFDTCGVWTVCGGVSPSDWPEWMREFEDY